MTTSILLLLPFIAIIILEQFSISGAKAVIYYLNYFLGTDVYHKDHGFKTHC